MRYYIVTTTKFADPCIEYLTYGSTQSNWLVNINKNDVVFISQFNYTSQCLFGPFRVTRNLFYNKSVIYPSQRYYYRIQFKPTAKNTKIIEETDLYLSAIKSKDVPGYFKTINLIQQNKHLHCIPLTDAEAGAILDTYSQFGCDYDHKEKTKLTGASIDINCKYIWQKNKLNTKRQFFSESDLETYLILKLKNSNTEEYKTINKLLKKFSGNNLHSSNVYNQYIFGNAYPADIAIINRNNINVFELKKEGLSSNSITQIEKEMKKHLFYSLSSNRIQYKNIRRFNFYLVYLKSDNNGKVKQMLAEKYNDLCKKVDFPRENTLTFIEYSIKANTLLLEEI